MSKSPNTVIVICGPTAVGKTAFAIQVAQHFNTSIISADSRQCYNELNIGVAKPFTTQLQLVKHYFINSHSIQQQVNAGIFEQYALQAANKIFANNPIAVMVGGTGLYIKAFCNGIDNIPSTPANVRKKLTEQYQHYGLLWLQSEVQKRDLAFWQIGEQQNPHRLLRALEVLEASGRSITTYQLGQTTARPFRIIKIGLELPRPVLNERINSRVHQMVKAGLIAEAKTLLPLQHLQALQTVGYRELFEYFNGLVLIEKAIENIQTNTRQYAKRQMTWFKKDDTIKWQTASNISISDIQSHL